MKSSQFSPQVSGGTRTRTSLPLELLRRLEKTGVRLPRTGHVVEVKGLSRKEEADVTAEREDTEEEQRKEGWREEEDEVPEGNTQTGEQTLLELSEWGVLGGSGGSRLNQRLTQVSGLGTHHLVSLGGLEERLSVVTAEEPADGTQW